MKQKPVVIFTLMVLAVVTTIMIRTWLLNKEHAEEPTLANTIEERAQEAQQATSQPIEAQPHAAAPSVPE